MLRYFLLLSETKYTILVSTVTTPVTLSPSQPGRAQQPVRDLSCDSALTNGSSLGGISETIVAAERH
jgi:hypothetical protein